jgi:hypothetical protein
MNATIEKGAMGVLDDQPIYSIIIDDETETDVDFMALIQIDGGLRNLEEGMELSPELVKQLERLPMFGSIEIELNISLDIVR